MIFETVAAAVTAVFAVFGLACLIKLIKFAVFGGITGAVVIADDDDIPSVIRKIRAAKNGSPGGKCGVVAFLPQTRKNDAELLVLLGEKGVKYYITEK